MTRKQLKRHFSKRLHRAMSRAGVARYKDGNRLGLRQRRAMAEVLRTEANHAGITDR